MDNLLRKFGDSFLDDNAKGQGFSNRTDSIFSEWITSKMASIMDDNHKKTSTVNEVHSYLYDLLERCNSEEEERNFFYKLSEVTDTSGCSVSSLRECAEKIVQLEEQSDEIFDTLEESVGLTESDDDDDDKPTGVPGWKEEKKGRIVKNKETGEKGVVVRSANVKGKKDVVVNPIKGSTVRKRTQKTWQDGSYEPVKD